MTPRSIVAACALLVPACGGKHPTPGNVDPVPAPGTSVAVTQGADSTLAIRMVGTVGSSVDSASVTAFLRGWMPLKSTGVDAFLRVHPTFDGRGVLIAVLDGGIDAGIPGLATTSTGDRKILDLRDFSGEGAVPLTRTEPAGDSIRVAGHWLHGVRRLAAISTGGVIWTGAVSEAAWGNAPAADVNGNGEADDTLPVVVCKASDGWVLYADTDGDGSLANEKPVHDFLTGRDTFGWSTAGRPSPLTLAANFREVKGAPELDLFFDGDAHGSHVTGIAAGHDLYGVRGFDGVAPGAQVIALKIARNAEGGISTSGSMMSALRYAIGFARSRRLPLVINMSYGVGNEQEGVARIDHLIDSVLAANPSVVFTIAASNDGPAVSTLGFPGSAVRPITVGATYPASFLPAPPPRQSGELLAYFSSRGGEVAKPDLVAPGIAWSSVPRWNRGDEQKGGTSMASPHVAGLAALLISGLVQDKRTIEGRLIKQALMVTAAPLAVQTAIDQGTGLANVGRAWVWLTAGHQPPEVTVAAQDHGATAAIRWNGLSSPADTIQRFTLTAPALGEAMNFRLQSDAPWLSAPASVSVGRQPVSLALSYHASAFAAPGVYTATISGWTADSDAGPAFRLVNTIVVPSRIEGAAPGPVTVPTNGQSRLFFAADSGRPFAVLFKVPSGSGQPVNVFLHEPGGQPFRDGNANQAAPGDEAAVFAVDGRDVVTGLYQATAAGSPYGPSQVVFDVERSPVAIHALRQKGGVSVSLENMTTNAVAARTALALIGAERGVSQSGHAGVERIPFIVPAWVTHIGIDIRMDPAQWPRFTDFGLTLMDTAGHRLATEPVNYALGRLTFDRPAGSKSEPLVVVLTPGFADTTGDTRWTADASIRLYADSTNTVFQDGPNANIGPGTTTELTIPIPDSRITMGEGFAPLGIVVVETGEHAWTREVPLPLPAGTLSP